MLSPKMATLLAFIVTDAGLPAPQLKASLRRAVRNSFNAITVDGDMSTNDTLLLLASGAAGNGKPSSRDAQLFAEGLCGVAESLARQLVRDGEGATKLVAIKVRGARSGPDAERIARQIANSPLVKTAFFGCDPNVGRITAAAGAAGVPIEPNRLDLMINDVKIAARGEIIVGALEAAAAAMRQREFTVVLNLKVGKSAAEVMTSDLSHDYVSINAEYTT
jgi:glutamate N-acetyltransferase/amino-acid N-acetyltransferase